MATVNLTKGGRVNLTKDNPGLKEIGVGLGWDINQNPNEPEFDLDVCCVAVDATNKLPDANWVCFFNNLSAFNGAVVHSGDNRDGQGEGDDETILINLVNVPAEVSKFVFMANIFEAKPTQNFGVIRNAYIRVYNKVTNEELLRYDLSEDYSVYQNLNVAELCRDGGEWKFKAITNGYNGDLNTGIAML